MDTETDQEARIVGVRFQAGGKVYHFDRADCDDLLSGDYVIVDTARGRQIGEVIYLWPAEDEKQLKGLKPVLLRATGRDLALKQHWATKSEKALESAREKAKELGLEIKLAAAEYTLDGKQLTILYVTEEKQNVKPLQRHLSRSLRTRVDLRQIGPRDHARMLGGYGACSCSRCCSTFLSEFTPISIRMGKKQGISLTPSEITGMCGRLRCCLSYEHKMYVQASEGLPRRKARVNTPHGQGKVIDLLPLKGIVVVQIEDRRVDVPAEEVEVIPR
jgi:cell fate regulator YaaT (PSP1 superfamily)